MKRTVVVSGVLAFAVGFAPFAPPRGASGATLAQEGAAGTFLAWTDVNIMKPMMCDPTHPLAPGMYKIALFTFPDNSVRVVFYLAGVEKGQANGTLQRVPLNLDAHRFLFTLQGQQWQMRIGDTGQDQALIGLLAAPGTVAPGFKGFVKPPKIGGAPARPH